MAASATELLAKSVQTKSKRAQSENTNKTPLLVSLTADRFHLGSFRMHSGAAVGIKGIGGRSVVPQVLQKIVPA
jgi:hypothetical protein